MRGPLRHALIASAALILGICYAISGCASDVGNVARHQSAGERTPPAGGQALDAPVMMVLGDSFTVGSGPVPPWRTYASEAARLLGWQPVLAGAGGTGYLNEGRAGRTFQRSFEEELAWRPAPDVLVVSGGHNDHRWSVLSVSRAARQLLRDARARWPSTRVIVVGPIWLDDAPAKAYAIRDTLARVAEREGVAFLDPLRERWITGSRAEVMLPDGVHPTFAGHLRLAHWLAAKLDS
ncbi:SGNH/GDSL hydrolase family protein [Nonomuraea sp. NPDC005983]|uniref:SGNH/GDSL hydrolase family protein n=1 Tax=Nonomuraea sp. NPDC005983 TaxID=3155595 RepID=UPI0033AAFE47